jgi:hypothetical protein
METIKPKITMENVMGVRYEVFRESINYEIAYHSGQLHQLGKDTPRGQEHFESMKALAELRNTVSPNDDATMEAVFVTLRAARVGRSDNVPKAKSA